MTKKTAHTPLGSSDDKGSASESPENRWIRAQLKLSNLWMVTGKVVTAPEPRPDDYVIHEAVPTSELADRETTAGTSEVHVSPRGCRRYHCPVCGASCKPISYEVRRYRHLPDMGYACTVVARVPKLKCYRCGGTPQVVFPMCDPRVSYTRDFAEVVLRNLTVGSRSSVARDMGVTTDVVDGVLDHHIRSALQEQDLSDVTGVYADEVQLGHGQDYITNFLNQRHKVVYSCKGHGRDAVRMFMEYLAAQGGDPENVRFFSTDMSAAYEAGITALFPNAVLVWDRFHLVKSINEALNDVRKRSIARAKGEPLRNLKYVVLRRLDNMTEKQRARFDQVRMLRPELGLAFDMKEAFCDIIEVHDRGLMRTLLTEWVRWVLQEGPKELADKAARVLEKMDRILDWTVFPVSNSVAEGVNKNIQDIRRQACGYRNAQNFYDMILLRQGELVFRI